MSTTDPESTRPRRGSMLWWLLSTTLIFWIVLSLLSSPDATHGAIPYSQFVAAVEARNVSQVTIAGDRIDGTFVKPAPLKTFHTQFPAVVGDPQLITLLRSKGVAIVVSSPAPPLYVTLASWLPVVLFGGFFLWMLSAARAGDRGGILSAFGRAKTHRYAQPKTPVSFDDVAGVDEAKTELQEEVDFLRRPAKYRELGARIPRGILLVGAPGTGKTLLARAVAGEAGANFFSLNASEFVEMFVGVGASRVRDLFAQAKAAAPAIVFIDELDAVGRRRGAGVGTVNDEREQTLNQLLAELDGFDERADVIILAATNRPDVLDPALLRPGRFDRQVVIDVPDRAGREAILAIHARKLRLAPGIDLALLARATIGMTGADLANLCNEAALSAARSSRTGVTTADFDESLDKLRLGAARARLVDAAERRIIAYHEAGHAVVAWLVPDADPVQKVTIVPHGQALGVTQQIPGQERKNLSRAYLEAKLCVMLAGRVTEEIVFGEVTTGAEKDLVEATSLAHSMVTRWGMGGLGLLAFKTDEEQPFLGYEMSQGREYSEATAARIDFEVERLLDEAHQRARTRLTGARGRLDRLAETLLHDETVELDGLTRILEAHETTKLKEVNVS